MSPNELDDEINVVTPNSFGDESQEPAFANQNISEKGNHSPELFSQQVNKEVPSLGENNQYHGEESNGDKQGQMATAQDEDFL